MRQYGSRLAVAACVFACLLVLAYVLSPVVQFRPTDAMVQDEQNAMSSDSNGNAHTADKPASYGAPTVESTGGDASSSTDGYASSGADEGAAAFDDASSQNGADDSGADQEDPVFVMPEHAEYESQAVLVGIEENADSQQISEELAGALGDVELQEVTDDCVRVVYKADIPVEEAVNRLLEADVGVDAQPNYVYYVMGDRQEEEMPEEEPAEPGEEMEQAAVDEADETNAHEAAEAEAAEVESAEANAHEVAEVGSALAEATAAQEASGGEEAASKEGNVNGAPAASAQAKASAKDGDVGLEAAAVKVNDSRASSQWHLKSINAFDAWSYAKSNHKVTVACMDLGFDLSHEDLRANYVDAYNAHNAAFGGSTTNVQPYNKSLDHGSHVAGIVGGVANNGKGVAGVSYNANIMPIKVVDDKGKAYTSGLVKAYEYVMSHRSARNIRVVNLSMGADVRSLAGSTMSLNKDDKTLAKIREAYAAGIVTVVAAGNEDASYTGKLPFECYPADSSYVVSVINLEQSGSGVVRHATSNYNASGKSTKNISAPGTNILSTVCSSDYEEMTGTSMAAPMVSGVLALEFAANPGLSSDDAVTLLYATAKSLGGSDWTRNYGWGEVDALAAAKAARDGMTSAQKTKASKVANNVNSVAVGEVQEQIAAIPAASKLRSAHASQVRSARSAYNALTVSQRNQVSNYSKLLEAEQRIKEVVRDENVAKGLTYRTHVQREGWQKWVANGTSSGTTGKSLRLEGIEIKLNNRPYSGAIQYRSHVQTTGWESSWRSAGQTSGTMGQSKRLEAIQIKLTDEMAKHYDVWYRVHAQQFGWMGWTKNGASAGSQGYSYRLEAIQIRLVAKGGSAPGSTANAFRKR